MLSENLNDWLATLHLRAPLSTVLLCGTHKDKCLPVNLVEKLLAGLKQCPSFEEILKDVEESVKKKHQKWKENRREGFRNRDEELQLMSGIQLVSSSPTLRYSDSGLPDLREKLQSCGTGIRWWIPLSWRLALEVLDAVRDKIDPVETARRFVNPEGLPPLQSAGKCTWIARNELSRHWKTVQDCSFLPAYLKADDPEFALKSVLDLR